MRFSDALQSTMRSENRFRGKDPEIGPRNKFAELLTVPHAIQIIKQNRRTSLILFGAVLGLVVVAVNLVPPTYQSESKLFVRVGRESITLDPTATTGQTISVYESRENEINSVVDVLESRVILEQIVQKLGPDLLEKAPKDGESYSKREIDAAVRGLSQAIEVSHPKKSSVITITTEAKSPELAQRILEEMLTAFREQHIRINRTKGSYEFFQEQWQREREELQRARKNLKEAKNAYGFASVEGRRQNLETQINATESAIMQNQRSLVALDAEIAALHQTAARMPQRVEAQKVTGFFNDADEQTREQIHKLEIEHRQLLTKYTERHPHVRAIKEQIDAGRAILANQSKPKNQTTTATNPAYQQLHLKLLTNLARRDALQAERASLREQRKTLQIDLEELNGNEMKLAELQEDVSLHQASFKAYGEKLEQARIDRELVDDSISNVNIVQPATYVPKPVGPKKRLAYALGFVVAAITAIGFGFVKELIVAMGLATKSESKPDNTEPLVC